jgi:hypothetical protein
MEFAWLMFTSGGMRKFVADIYSVRGSYGIKASEG